MRNKTAHTNICLFIASITILFAGTLTAQPSDTRPVDALTVMEKITARVINEHLMSSDSIGDLADQIGITSEELEEVAGTLGISLDHLRPPPEPLSAQMLASDRYRPDVILDMERDGSAVILVEKQTHTLYLLRYEGGRQELVARYECKTGKQEGDKQVEGDEKTPEGIYFFNARYERDDIQTMVGKGKAYEYGELAFATDYPNRIDRLNDKDGSGIWLHGTDESFSATSSLDTRGCVVTTNETILEIAPYIVLNQTPIIIVETLTFSPVDEHARRSEEARERLLHWRDSWKSQDIEAYIGCYSQQFTNSGRNLRAWRQYKESLFQAITIEQIDLSQIGMFRYNGGLVMQFDQDYRASNLSSTNTKVLYFMDHEQSWQIVAETIQR